MRYGALVAIAMFFIGLAAQAQEAKPLGPELWEEVKGSWTFGDGEAVFSTVGASGAIRLKDVFVHDFDFTCEVKAENASLALAVRAHYSPELYKNEKKRIKFGAEGLYGGMFIAGTGQGALGIVSDQRVSMFDRTVQEVKPAEWHTIRIRGEAGKWQLWVNGNKAEDSFDEYFLAGGIFLCAIADSDATEASVHFRNAQLEDLGRVTEWRPLFNGKDFSGWKEWGSEKWSVEDGIIYGRSGEKKSEGYLATEETFKDFRVRGEFKMLGEGNFGLFFHSTITLREDDGYPLISGMQGEVEPGHPSSTGWVYESYKRGWLVEPPKNTLAAYVLDPEGWNEIEIWSKNNHITTWVNGVRALDLEDENRQLFEGSFALQLHAGGVDGIAWKEIHVLKD
jgi:hypothetical protein